MHASWDNDDIKEIDVIRICNLNGCVLALTIRCLWRTLKEYTSFGNEQLVYGYVISDYKYFFRCESWTKCILENTMARYSYQMAYDVTMAQSSWPISKAQRASLFTPCNSIHTTWVSIGPILSYSKQNYFIPIAVYSAVVIRIILCNITCRITPDLNTKPLPREWFLV